MPAAPIMGRVLRCLPLAASTLALATALSGPVYGQSSTPNSYIAPQPTVSSGSVTPDYNTANTDIYTVNTPTAVLNFTPSGTPDVNGNINFQNAGTHVIYENNVGGSNFTVLNRILPSDPTRPIVFNGDVTSQLHPAAGVTVRGGSVWFYSPGGIILGDNSVFDVGSLLLATADPTGGTGTIGSTAGFTLNTANPDAIINILSLATINATNPNSYVAIVAPTVLQRGTINVNGAAAFVAAEQATLSFANGLFDISVTVGSDGTSQGGLPLQLRGTVSLDRSSGTATDNRGIYAVAVPKNTAISMIVAPDGFYGFDVAQGAIVANGAVYLQAGGNLSVTPGAETRGLITDIPTVAGASINIQGSSDPTDLTGGRFTARVAARASDQIDVANQGFLIDPPFSPFASAISFGSDLAIYGGTSASLSAAAGTIPIAGSLDIQSFGQNTPGSAALSAGIGGAITIGGSTLVNAGSPAGFNIGSVAFDFRNGGSASVSAKGGGTITSQQFMIIDALGNGAVGQASHGGTAGLVIDDGSITAPNVTLSAAATGFDSASTGGTATADIANGQLQAALAILIDASASSASLATGGTAQMTIRQGGVVSALNQAQISADAQGIDAQTTGPGVAAVGGTALLTMLPTTGPTTSFTVAGDLNIEATALGGAGGSAATSGGGAGTGGTVTVNIGSGARLAAATGFLSTYGYGGTSTGGGAGGMGSGGAITVDTSGILDFGLLSLSADAIGGNKTGITGNAGDAASGTARLRVNGGSIAATRSTGNPTVQSGIVVGIQATGGSVNAGSGSGGYGRAGGAISGLGSAGITVQNDATVSTARLSVSANGTGGEGRGVGDGGFGRAADASILLQTDGALQIGTVTVQSNAIGGGTSGGAGGEAAAGLAELISAPSSGATGATAITGAVDMSANATGGSGLSGGVATSSLVSIRGNGVNFGTTIGGDVTLASTSTGGNANSVTGSGGDATSSTIRIDSSGGLALAGALFASADATGGFTNGGPLNGGNATGGSVQLQASAGDLSVAGAALLGVGASSGSHGAGSGSAGNAVAGSISLGANAGSLTLAGGAQTSATAFGGVSAAGGGSATGGSVSIVSEPDPDSGLSGGSIAINGLYVTLGANASQLNDQSRLGGAATGGAFTVLADTGPITLDGVNVLASAGGYGGSDPTTTVMQGGTALIEARNADITVNGTLFISATGEAATVFNSNPPAGPGASIGGTVDILAAAGHGITVTDALNVEVDAISGRSSFLNTPAGSGTGGQIAVTAAGTITVGGSLTLSAQGIGGNVFGGSTAKAGTGFGGSIDIGVTGLLDVAQGIGVSASGRGGQPQTGVGGDGIGGLARIRATQGGVVRTSSINLAADGNGSFGGAGTGGRTTVNSSGVTTLGGAYLIASGGTITGSTTFTITANGTGGGAATGNGGAGTGGQAWIIGMNGTVDLSSGTAFGTLQAAGIGGGAFGDDGGAGGIGTGGQVLIGQSSVGANQGATSTSTGRILLGDVIVDATARGGNGAQGVGGGQGGAGGAGTGGSAEVSADGAFGVLLANAGTTLTVAVGGTGGAGGAGGGPDPSGSGGSGGTGGGGNGGSAFVGTSSAPAGAATTTGSATFADISLDATGAGGAGGSATAAGGVGRGGSLIFASTGAPVTAANVDLVAVGTGGGSGAGIGGSATVSVAPRVDGVTRGSLSLSGDTTVDTSGSSSGGATTAGTHAFTVASGVANVGLYSVTNDGATPSATISRISATDGLLAASGITVEGTGNLLLAAGVGGPIQAGSVLIQATGSLTSTDGTIPSSGTIAVTNDFTAIAGSDYTLGGPLSVGGVYSVTSGGAISTADATASGGVTFVAANGIGTGAVTSSAGTIALTARAGSITTGNLQSGGNVALLAKTGITTGSITARRTSGGYVLLADAANAGAIDINATGVAMAGPVSVGGPVSAAILRTSTTGTTTFGGAIDVAQYARIAAGDISLAGAVIGPDLGFSSGNIRLGTNASIGDANTQTVAFTVTGGGPAFLGGTSDGSGYTLDASELSRVRATNVSFNAGPSLAVQDAILSGNGAGASANITGASGALTLASSGTITVTGNLRFNNAGSGQSLVMNAGAVRLVTDTGSIGVFSTGDTPSGRLAIGANSIEAGTAQLLGSASFAGPLAANVTSAIGAAAAQPRQAGVIQAGRIELAARDDIIIQNTGTAALAAGFSTGSGGLAIANRGGTTAAGGFNVLIYGRVQGERGFITNADTLAAVSFASAQGTALSGYSTQSVVNGCAIVAGAGCIVAPVVTPPPVAALVRDVIDGNLITVSRDSVLLPSFEQPAALDLTFLQTPLVITDPVASAGNPILWESSSAMSSTGPAGPATGKKQIDEDRRRKAADGEQAR